ncbi:hypothetical protein DB30_07777 [Enhygromyxa salina]|uniref:Uncharacterized protein n=1 Tax=Enhygromyxa salina TaxID=215803 RepID=A0A0C2DGG4_9BACT|nr:hypothetical protein [Enhygromyxa salina]KIG18762.1 hypothetical protein DB30_07777 [Enhygromyxa salina]
MSWPASWLALAFGLVLGVAGCEKDQPPVAEPSPDAAGSAHAIVVVEDPGANPTPAPPDPEASHEPAIGTTKIVASDVACQSDADCVKSTCCHATSCVAATDAPDCASTMCTTDCRGGTMDCNGGCLCQAGKCAARLWWAPE